MSFDPVYTDLQSDPDNIEVIRDQIAALLFLDLQNQYELAVDDADPNAGDYNVGVYIENDDPLQYLDDNVEDSNPFPCVNVSLDSTDAGKGTAGVNKQDMTAQIVIDCYATGNTSSTADFGTKASLKAWKVARLVRRILRAEANTYLRLRGIVGRVAWSFQGGEPSNTRSAIKVKMVRVTLTIDYVENVAITEGELDWDIVGIVADETGRVHFGGDKEKEENEENGDS